MGLLHRSYADRALESHMSLPELFKTWADNTDTCVNCGDDFHFRRLASVVDCKVRFVYDWSFESRFFEFGPALAAQNAP
jgi:hypothetical protein